MKAQKGYILYRGPSALDGKPIVVIATMSSGNRKTGKSGRQNMVQTWIMRSDIEPHIATQTGDDASVCGDCVHRHHLGGACYVTTFQAPLSIFRAFKRGLYSTDLAEFYAAIADRLVRFGAYGDPSAMPIALVAEIAAHAKGYTGYTHQWERPGFDSSILSYVMASVDTEAQARSAPGRYFRVKRDTGKALRGEVECLSDSVGKTCAECLLCDGGKKGKSVYINIHGARASSYAPDLIATA